jgi:hypothetical protein
MDQWRRPSGEFKDFDLGELGQACLRLSFEVRARKTRTRDARIALANSVGDALMRAAKHLTPEPHGAATPENRHLRGTSIVESFGQWHETEMRSLRYRTIQRAALAALGERAKAWLDEMWLPYDQRHGWIAQKSDCDLAEQLRALDAEILGRMTAPTA